MPKIPPAGYENPAAALSKILQAGKFKETHECPHCGKAFHKEYEFTEIKQPYFLDDERWGVQTFVCPMCRRPTLNLVRGIKDKKTPNIGWDFTTVRTIVPLSPGRKLVHDSVPDKIKEDYVEACDVLPISTKASAALARRCLQSMLRARGYDKRNLVDQIDDAVAETDIDKALPKSLRETIDAIRHYGNFSAHPLTDVTTLQVIDVEPGEAEWCLEIIEELFEHFYAEPARRAAKREALNAKLAAAGKPEMRSGDTDSDV